MINVLLVDDHELVRSGIQLLLNSVPGINVTGVCGCGESALAAAAEHAIDVILMDINMPGIGGIEASRRLLQSNPDIKIIGLSAQNSGSTPQQFMKLGVSGFISKSTSVTEMVDAIQTAMAGGRYLGQDVANNLANEADEPEVSPFNELSTRETEVVRMILDGKSIQEMAENLQISDKSINTYRYRLYRKLNVKNDVELTRLAIKLNIPQIST